MRNAFFRSFLCLPIAAALAIFAAGCSSPNTTITTTQQVWNIAWLPNESNGMLAYMDQVVENSDGSYDTTDNVYRVSTNGTVGNALNPTNIVVDVNYWNAPITDVSSDGSTAITQFGTDIYNIALGSGNVTDIIKGTALFGVSPDGKYVATTTSGSQSPNKYLVINTLSGNSATQATSTDIPGLASNRVLWLNNDDYAITLADSVFSHVTIYNIGGDAIMTIPNATVEFSNAAFSPDSNNLFVETNVAGIDRINLTTGTRTNIVADSVDSMDASSDGTVLVYTSNASLLPYGTLYAVNMANLHTALVSAATPGIVKPVISPMRDMVACVQLLVGSNYNSDIAVFPLSIPK